MTRAAVVGHVESVEFVRVGAYPERGGIAEGRESWSRAAGGGTVAAIVLAGLAGGADFFSALGLDANGESAVAELTPRGVRVHASRRPQPTRRAITLIDPDGERTIVTIGERLEPRGQDELDWGLLARADGAYLTAGDASAAERARSARVLVASPRAIGALRGSSFGIDALVFSGSDEHERRWAGELESRVRLMVQTEGAGGGRWWGEQAGTWETAALPGARQDAYGCGDSFAAGFTFGLASGRTVAEAAALGAERGAFALTVAGAP